MIGSTPAKWLPAGATAVVILALLVTVAAAVAWQRLPIALPAGPVAPPTPPSWSPATSIPAEAWDVFKPSSTPVARGAGALADQYRLAGTFFAFGATPEETASPVRQAILDDIQKRQQFIVREGEQVEAYRVTSILKDRIVLARDGSEFDLWLSFSGGGAAAVAARGSDNPPAAEEVAIESSRFGKRVGRTRWVFQRDELKKYYYELLDDPERLASLYLSMKPDYQEDEIAGYVVKKEGEQDFFRAVGLEEGDVVRRVNSMRMISQPRAEYFVREFMKDRLGAVVLDIERGGQEEKLVYLLR